MRLRAVMVFALFSLGACASMDRPPPPPPPPPADGGVEDADVDGASDSGVAGDGALDSALDAAPPVDAGPPLRVLFVGNSYTAVNDLPGVVQAIGAATPGGAVEVESVTVGGARLRDHWMSTGARARVEAAEHDAVVMQGQSLETLFDPAGFSAQAALFSDAFVDAGSTGVWYATWARREGDAVYGPAIPDPQFMTDGIEAAYSLAAARNGERVARVGAAWMIALAELPEVTLHSGDGSHPMGAGTLLAACVIHQALTRETPRLPDPPPLGLDSSTAEALCAIAPRVRCLETETICDDDCVDTMTDALHCGGCGLFCDASELCTAGVCG